MRIPVTGPTVYSEWHLKALVQQVVQRDRS
jgi:hypothetical protein